MPGLRGAHRRNTRDSYWTKYGLTLPGYKYCGPFNKLHGELPTNPSDKACAEHDEEYDRIDNPYTTYSEADRRFIERTTDARLRDDYGGYLGNKAFRLKRLAADAGILEISPVKKQKAMPRKRLRESYEPDIRALKRLSLSDSQPSTNTAKRDTMSKPGSGNEKGLTETPVDQVDVWKISRGPPDYTFASLPFLRDAAFTQLANTYEDVYRMTSPYDPAVTIASADHNTGAGANTKWSGNTDGNDATINKARWFDFYGGIYNYYHVIGCRWHLTVENLSTKPVWVHIGYSNETALPLGATNQDIQLWSGVESHYVGPVAHAITASAFREANDLPNGENQEDAAMTTTANYETTNHVPSRGKSNLLMASGEYRTGDYRRVIHLDSQVENWTATSTNPTLSERLWIRYKPHNMAEQVNSANSQDDWMSVHFSIRLEYLVEFKELKDGVRYPVARQPATITLNTSTHTTT